MGHMAKIANTDFKRDFGGGITNDAATQQRLTAAGVDGKAMLDGVDADKNGKIEGAELDALWKKIDEFDHDGNAGSITDLKALSLVGALRTPGVGPALERGAKGAEVKAAQDLLIALGYSTGEKGADSDFGGSTFNAVKLFQSDNGLPVTGILDATTLAKLKAAKPVTPEYGEMFKDGILQTTYGIGFDEAGWGTIATQEVVTGLIGRGFHQLDATELAAKGLPADGVFYVKTFKYQGKDVEARVRFVNETSANPKAQFATGMKNDDLIIYGGHGRRGSGPDFDADKSPAGNFVVGPPYEEGHYTLGANDLDKPNALSSGYQLMFFNGCNTKLYADDFRSRASKKGDKTLDLVLTSTELYWSETASNTLIFLDGVMAGKSMKAIKDDLEANNQYAASEWHGEAFRTDGFRNNGR